MPTPPPYVATFGPDRAVIKHAGRHARALRRLGFSRAGFLFGPFEIVWRTNLDWAPLGALAMQLRDLGLAFSAGREWSPVEVIEHLRDLGHFEGAFTEIYWGRGEGWTLRAHAGAPAP